MIQARKGETYEKIFISWIICLSLILGGMPQVLPVADTYGEETAETETGKTVDLFKI